MFSVESCRASRGALVLLELEQSSINREGGARIGGFPTAQRSACTDSQAWLVEGAGNCTGTAKYQRIKLAGKNNRRYLTRYLAGWHVSPMPELEAEYLQYLQRAAAS